MATPDEDVDRPDDETSEIEPTTGDAEVEAATAAAMGGGADDDPESDDPTEDPTIPDDDRVE